MNLNSSFYDWAQVLEQYDGKLREEQKKNRPVGAKKMWKASSIPF